MEIQESHTHLGYCMDHDNLSSAIKQVRKAHKLGQSLEKNGNGGSKKTIHWR